ncbi:MAG: peptidyl-prolyl cis-trans isomerase [Candidatus Omnitrophica bacterium]|nr:peptidyl-prolyl cis-trans isomerase [Candidatus Omnitrophota bacterium]
MKKIYINFLLLFTLIIFISCQKSSLSSKTTKKVEYEEYQINGPLLAQVNDWKLGVEDFNKSLKALEPLLKEQNITMDYNFKAKVLDELVRNAILAQEAKNRGFEEDKEIIQALKNYKQTLLAEKIKDEITKEIYITESEVEEFYNQNKQSFKSPPQFKIREIVVDSEEKAKALSKRILDGEDFSSLALNYSIAESAKKGGDLDFISFDPNVKFEKFWVAVASLEEGGVSNYFKGPDNKYYIIKLEKKKEGEVIPLSKIKYELKKGLEEVKRKEKIDALVNAAKQKYKIIINNDLLK